MYAGDQARPAAAALLLDRYAYEAPRDDGGESRWRVLARALLPEAGPGAARGLS